MNPGPKNSKNTAVTFARKKYRNKRTKLQGQKKNTRLHWPAPRQTKMPPQRCWTTKATENPEQNQESGGEREKKKSERKPNKESPTRQNTVWEQSPRIERHMFPNVRPAGALGFHTEIQARRAAKQRTWVKQNKTQRKEKKKRTQKAHMKKSNEQQQSDLRDRDDQKYAHPQDRHQPSKTTRFHNNAICYVLKKKANFFKLQRQQHMSVRP